MSALEAAVAGRPSWRMLPDGKARYAREGLSRVAVIAPNEALGGFDCEVLNGGGVVTQEWFEAELAEAIHFAEREAEEGW